jgi:hypothetical protein
MGLIVLLGFVGWCLAALASPPVSLNLLLLLFATEQILQSSVDFLRGSSAGLQFTNYLVAFIVTLSALISVVRRPDLLRGSMSTGQLAVIALYVWMLASCLWSPGRVDGSEAIRLQWPYFVLTFLIAPLLIGDIRDLSIALKSCLVIVVAQAVIMLLSPEFAIVGGRLGVALGAAAAGGRSNPLVIGEVGGICMILGAMAGAGGGSRWAIFIRIAALVLGSVLAILSGSRGQFLFAVVSLVVGFPLARPSLNVQRYVSGLLAALVLVPLVLWVASAVLESGSADMVKRWSSESSGTGTAVRSENAVFLLQAYLASPMHWLQGLGFYAFSAINPYGQPYTHVLFADLLGEEGLIGTGIFLIVAGSAIRSARDLWRWTERSPEQRRAIATLITLAAYQTLLANKQGNLAGGFVLFGLVIIICRLRERARESSDWDVQPLGDPT